VVAIAFNGDDDNSLVINAQNRGKLTVDQGNLSLGVGGSSAPD
jgi:hypothetical protein